MDIEDLPLKVKGANLKISRESLGKAYDETSASLATATSTLYAVAIFCVLTLLAPDVVLLTNTEKVTVPLISGPVSYIAFLFIGPSVMLAVRIYIQFYYEHWLRLEIIRRRHGLIRAPTLTLLNIKLLGNRGLAGFGRQHLLPIMLLFFAWKGDARLWMGGILETFLCFCLFAHCWLLIRTGSNFRPWVKWLLLKLPFWLALCSPLLIPFSHILPHRGLELSYVDLTHQSLQDSYLRNAIFKGANLSGADFSSSEMISSMIEGANLNDVDFSSSDLSKSIIRGGLSRNTNFNCANLENAGILDLKFEQANFEGANFEGTTMSNVSFVNSNIREDQLENIIPYNVCINGVHVKYDDNTRNCFQ